MLKTVSTLAVACIGLLGITAYTQTNFVYNPTNSLYMSSEEYSKIIITNGVTYNHDYHITGDDETRIHSPTKPDVIKTNGGWLIIFNARK